MTMREERAYQKTDVLLLKSNWNRCGGVKWSRCTGRGGRGSSSIFFWFCFLPATQQVKTVRQMMPKIRFCSYQLRNGRCKMYEEGNKNILMWIEMHMSEKTIYFSMKKPVWD